MQIIPSDQPVPAPLTCSGCRHWMQAATGIGADSEPTGRCERFEETRPGTARPRCNICWEPATAAPTRTTTLAGN